jgi:hypothetical protein
VIRAMSIGRRAGAVVTDMNRYAGAAIALCALGVAGCAGDASKPYTNHANLEMYDPPRRSYRAPPPRAEALPVGTAGSQVVEPHTVGATPIPAAESLAARRERQAQEDKARDDREAERLNRVVQICRAC